MQRIDEERRIRDPLVGRIPKHRLDLRARVDVRALGVDPVHVDGERKLLDERPVAVLRAPERLLGPLSLRHVDREALAERGPSVRRIDDHGLILEPDDRTGFRANPVLAAERSPAGVHGLPLREHAFAIVLVHGAREHVRRPQPLLDGVPENALDLRADVVRLRERIGRGVHVGDERELLDERPIPELCAPQAVFGVSPVAHVAQAGREERGSREVDPADSELGGEQRSVRAHRLYLDSPAEQRARPRSRPGLGPACEGVPVRVAVVRGNHDLGELAPEHLFPGIAERPFGREVELEDAAEMVDRDDGVERRIENRKRVRLAQADRARHIRSSIRIHRMLTIVYAGLLSDPPIGLCRTGAPEGRYDRRGGRVGRGTRAALVGRLR